MTYVYENFGDFWVRLGQMCFQELQTTQLVQILLDKSTKKDRWEGPLYHEKQEERQQGEQLR